jgi:hypothetical protein
LGEWFTKAGARGEVIEDELRVLGRGRSIGEGRRRLLKQFSREFK